MQNNKKDINAILASLDPKLLEKIEFPVQQKAEEVPDTADVQPAEQAAEVPEIQEAAAEPVAEAPVKDKLTEAEERAAAILEFEGSKKEGVKQRNGAAYLAIELLILEIIAFFLFFATFRSEEWGGVGLIAMLMPAIVGILMRMFRDQLSLKDAVSKCKLHIILSCFFLVCVMLSA